MRTRLISGVTLLVVGALTLAACGKSDGHSSADGAAGSTVTIATHDSWAMSKSVLAEFKAKTGKDGDHYRQNRWAANHRFLFC